MEPSRVMVLPTFSRRDSISRSDCRDSARSSSSASSRSNSFSVSPSIGNPLPHSTKQQQRQGREKTAFSFCATDFPFWARQSGFLSLSKIDFGNPCSRQKWLSKKPRVLLCLVCVCWQCLACFTLQVHSRTTPCCSLLSLSFCLGLDLGNAPPSLPDCVQRHSGSRVRSLEKNMHSTDGLVLLWWLSPCVTGLFSLCLYLFCASLARGFADGRGS